MDNKNNFLSALFKIIGAAVGWLVSSFMGLPPMAQALLIAQGADVLTGVLCALTGRSQKTESGRASSSALFIGIIKKGLEWLVVLVVKTAGVALEMQGITGAAMAYMIATELVSLMENLELFGLSVPLMDRLLDIAYKQSGAEQPEDHGKHPEEEPEEAPEDLDKPPEK